VLLGLAKPGILGGGAFRGDVICDVAVAVVGVSLTIKERGNGFRTPQSIVEDLGLSTGGRGEGDWLLLARFGRLFALES
jgi:hypothetical protein